MARRTLPGRSERLQPALPIPSWQRCSASQMPTAAGAALRGWMQIVRKTSRVSTFGAKPEIQGLRGYTEMSKTGALLWKQT